MPISFTPIRNGKHWAGYSWSIDDDHQLAELVAHIALGQYRHVIQILEETGLTNAVPALTAVKGARQLLTVPEGSDPFHRDGWLFQAISWVAARIQNEASLIAPPHMMHTDKGFDGLHVHIDEQSRTVHSVVICEDKATTNARDTIRDQVWKDFADLETGIRDHLLTAQVSALLEARPDLDHDQAVQKILWKQARAFRVSITVSDSHADAKGHKRLFKGYSKVVSGGVSRRRAETLHLDDLRCWMRRISKKALKAAKRMADADV